MSTLQTTGLAIHSSFQGGQKLATFGKGKNNHKNFGQGRIYYFRDKWLVFERNCIVANLNQYNMRYMSCNSTHLAQETLFLTLENIFLPKDFQNVRKSQKILISRILGLKIFVRIQIFDEGPLCLRTTFATLPHSCSGLVSKRLSPMEVITLGQSTTIFLCIRSFSAWWHCC